MIDWDIIEYKLKLGNSFIIAIKILNFQRLLPHDLTAYIPESNLFREGVICNINTGINVNEILSVAELKVKLWMFIALLRV